MIHTALHAIDFRRLFDASPNAYAVIDRDLRYVYTNPSYVALRESEPTLATSDAPIEASLRKVFATGASHTVERVSHSPIRDDTGAIGFVLQHLQASGERPTADTPAIDDQLRSLRALFAQSPGFATFLRGPDHVFELSNPGAERLFGGRAVLGRPIREAMPNLAGQGYFELLDRVYETREPFRGTAMRGELLDANDVPFTVYVDMVFQPILGRDREPIGILVQGFEVTEQVLASRRQNFLTHAFEHLAISPDVRAALCDVAELATQSIADYAIVDLFDDGRANRIACTCADLRDAELARRSFQFPLPPEIPTGHVFHERKGAVHIVSPFTEEHIARSARSEQHAALLREMRLTSLAIVPLWHRGRLYGTFSVMSARTSPRFGERDLPALTELGRLASSALDNARLNLERDALLAREQEARVRAEAANRAKDDFLAMLGHELRNPLAPISTAIQLLRLTEDPPRREHEIIERQTRHLVRLVDDLLDISRIVHGKIELRRETADLASIAKKAVEIAHPMIAQKQHTLHVELTDAQLVADEARLAQAISNLLTNAARYTPVGGTIWLSSARVDDRIEIRVRDTGVGLPPDMLSTIFDMFVQVPQASDRASGGLGVGLTLVQRIVQMHDGSVSAHSEGLGRGAEIVIRLPASPIVREAATTTPPTAPVATPTTDAVRVLLVDDNRDALELLSELLRRRGCLVTAVIDADEALRAAAQQRFDIAVLDLGLPVRDGVELAGALRALLGSATPTLIALTGYNAAEDRARTAAAGFAHHLSKPVDTKALLRLIQAFKRPLVPA